MWLMRAIANLFRFGGSTLCANLGLQPPSDPAAPPQQTIAGASGGGEAAPPSIFSSASPSALLGVQGAAGPMKGGRGAHIRVRWNNSWLKVAPTLSEDSAPFAPLASLEAESRPQQPQATT